MTRLAGSGSPIARTASLRAPALLADLARAAGGLPMDIRMALETAARVARARGGRQWPAMPRGPQGDVPSGWRIANRSTFGRDFPSAS